jgi:hypothetical protein
MKRLLWKVLDRHDDGSKHTWVSDLQATGSHWCEWDYCHCYERTCTGCGETRVVSTGSLEVR